MLATDIVTKMVYNNPLLFILHASLRISHSALPPCVPPCSQGIGSSIGKASHQRCESACGFRVLSLKKILRVVAIQVYTVIDHVSIASNIILLYYNLASDVFEV